MQLKKTVIVLLTMVLILGMGLPSAYATETADTMDVYGRYEEPIKLTSVFVSSTAIEEMLAGLGTGETIEDNRWTRLMKDVLNIEVEYIAVVDAAQYNEKINIMLASGQMPDFLTDISATTVKQMVEGELLMPVRELFDDWASDENKALHGITRYLNWTAFNFNDDYYAIPTVGEGDTLDSTSMLWIRRDWLENLNLDLPETLEELDAIIEAFATGDPDQNGVDGDTLGLGLLGGDQFLELAAGYFNSNSAYPKIWLDKEGKLEKGLIQPEVKNTLSKLHDLYVNGSIDTEFSIKGSAQLGEDIANGKVGLFFGSHASPLLYGFAAEKAVDPNTDWVSLPIPGKSSVPAASEVIDGVVISKNCENPEAIVKMMNVSNLYDLLAADNETKEYYVTDGHNFVRPVTYPHPSMGNLYMALVASKMMEGMDFPTARDAAIDEFYSEEDAPVLKEIFKFDTQSIVYNLFMPYVESGSSDAYPWYIIFGPEGSEHVLRYYWDNYDAKLQPDMYSGPVTELMSQFASTEQTMRDEMFVRIIMGEDDISAFDTFVQNFMAVGGTDVTNEANEWYAQQAE